MPPLHNLDDETNHLNELASNIHSVNDARRFIDAIAEIFADDLPPAWTTASVRNRLAQAEYLTVTDPLKRIPEKRLAEAWNNYRDAVGAPADPQVSSAEIHALRETHFTRGRAMWKRGYRNFWLLPSIFATEPDATLAPTCRLVEAFRMLYDLFSYPETIRGIREWLASRTPNSEVTEPTQQNLESAQVRAGIQLYTPKNLDSTTDPVEAAARRERSTKQLTNMIETLLNGVLNT